MCNDKPYCKDTEEIKAFIRNKYLVLLYNQIRFDSNSYENEAMVPESRLKWIPINSRLPLSVPYEI